MKKAILSILILALPLSVRAQYSISTEGAASVGATALRVFRDPAALGSGGMSALTPSALAAFSNPGTVPFAGGMMDAAVAYECWQPGLGLSDDINAGITYNIADKAGIAFGFAVDNQRQSLPGADENGVHFDAGVPASLLLGLGASWRFVDCLALGVNAKYMMQHYATLDINSLSFDALLTFRKGSLSAAAGVREIGPELDGGSSLPSSVNASAMYDAVFGAHAISPSVEADWYFFGALRAAAGLQYSWKNTALLRLGYNYGGDSLFGDFVSLGGGWRWRGLHIDAAYLLADGPLANTFSIGLGYKF